MSWKVNNLLYAAGPELRNTIRMGIDFTEPVHPEALQAALEKAAIRFPYFAVRLAKCGEAYCFEPNALPFVLSPHGRTVTLGTQESNHHLMAFAYDGCRLFYDLSHFITDGNGMFPFMKTLIYYYLHTLHPEEDFDTANIALAGSPIPDGEADDDPYPTELLPEAPLGERSRPAEIFLLPDQPPGYEGAEHWTGFPFRIAQKELMAFASGVDGSPASVIASLLFQAISDLHPENRLPLVCGMQHQFRGALGRPRSHLCHVNIVPMVYPDRMRGKSLEALNTVSRGMLILRADDANDVLTVNQHIRNEKRIRDMTLPEKHEYMRSVVLEGIGRNTFEVSYTGRVDWCGLDRYIAGVLPYFDISLSGGLSVEIFSVGSAFSILIMLRSGNGRYAERFAERLAGNGIHYSMEAPEHFELCGFQLPEEENKEVI